MPNAIYGVKYEPINPPLMARWEGSNATARWTAFSKDKIDGGTVSFLKLYQLVVVVTCTI